MAGPVAPVLQWLPASIPSPHKDWRPSLHATPKKARLYLFRAAPLDISDVRAKNLTRLGLVAGKGIWHVCNHVFSTI